MRVVLLCLRIGAIVDGQALRRPHDASSHTTPHEWARNNPKQYSKVREEALYTRAGEESLLGKVDLPSLEGVAEVQDGALDAAGRRLFLEEAHDVADNI